MGMLPGIVQPETLGHDVFATTGFEMDPISVTEKGCVGELSAISSSQKPQIVSPSNFSAFPTSFDFFRDSGPFSQNQGHDSWTSLPTNSHSSTSAEPTLSIPYALTPQQSGNFESVSPNDSVFKSPTTPASAAATSPVLDRMRGKRKASVAPAAPKRVRSSSRLTQAMSYNESDLPVRPHAPPPTFSSPFLLSPVVISYLHLNLLVRLLPPRFVSSPS